MELIANAEWYASFRLAAVVVPVALYFFVLGLLNTRRTPQLLRARVDTAMLMVVLGPLVMLPVLDYLGTTLLAGVVCAGICAASALLMPPGSSWVIYNIRQDHAMSIVSDALGAAGVEHRAGDNGYVAVDGGVSVETGGFALLRNVTVRMRGGDRDIERKFQQELQTQLDTVRAANNPMAQGMLVVSVAMLAAPLALVVNRAGQIVRVITDLLQ